MSLQRAAGPDVDTCFNFEAEPTKQSREGTITGPGRKPICELRMGSAVKFNYQGKLYRSVPSMPRVPPAAGIHSFIHSSWKIQIAV